MNKTKDTHVDSSNTKKIYFAVCKITTWQGLSAMAEHYSGKLYLNDCAEMTIENIEEWGIPDLGIELRSRLRKTMRNPCS